MANDAHISAAETAHLRELLEQRICAMEKLFHERITLRDRALELSADEYHRRLDMLNGEAGKLAAMQVTYLPREVYEQTVKNIENELKGLRDFRSNIIGKFSIINGAIAIIVSLAVSLFVTMIMK